MFDPVAFSAAFALPSARPDPAPEPEPEPVPSSNGNGYPRPMQRRIGGSKLRLTVARGRRWKS